MLNYGCKRKNLDSWNLKKHMISESFTYMVKIVDNHLPCIPGVCLSYCPWCWGPGSSEPWGRCYCRPQPTPCWGQPPELKNSDWRINSFWVQGEKPSIMMKYTLNKLDNLSVNNISKIQLHESIMHLDCVILLEIF